MWLTLSPIKVTSDPAPTQLKVFLALHDAAAGHASQMSKKTLQAPTIFSYNLAEIVVLQVSRNFFDYHMHFLRATPPVHLTANFG